jgi:hypothetical protein
MKKLLAMCMVFVVAFGGVTLAANVISVNIDTAQENQLDPANLGGVNYTAGVVPVMNWNDFTSASGAWKSLHDNSGTATSAELQAFYNNYFPMVCGGYSTDFENIGDQRLMSGHIYNSAGTDIVVNVKNIPYAQYDVYVYYNSGGVTGNAQLFTIDGTSFAAVGAELSMTRDTAFVLAQGMEVDANYVKFSGVNLANITLRAHSEGESFNYINGLQIVEVPEPAMIGLLGMGLMFIRRKVNF